MSAWLPMETAPRDGTWIVGWFVDRPVVVRWRCGRSNKRYESMVKVWFWSGGYFRYPEPTAWQPAPQAPEQRQEAA